MGNKNNGTENEKYPNDFVPSNGDEQNDNTVDEVLNDDAVNDDAIDGSFNISDDNLQKILDDRADDIDIHSEMKSTQNDENGQKYYNIINNNMGPETSATDYDTFEKELQSYEKRNQIIKYSVAGAALVLVLVSVFFVSKHFINSRNALLETQVVNVTDYNGENVTNANGEDVTQVVVPETETVAVTNSDGEKVTDKSGEVVTKVVPVTNASGETVTKVVDQTTTKRNSSTTSKATTTTPSTTKKPTTTTTTKKPTTTKPSNPIDQQAGVLGFLWNEQDQVFYSAANPWQRQFGYHKVYDIGAGLFVIYMDTVRIKFDYGGLNWMVQCWKGQYGFVLLGAEVGVYYKSPDSGNDFYECTDENNKLHVGYTVYNKGNVLFNRTYQSTWWLTGFVGGRVDRFADRSQLTMKIRITLKDAEMAEKFVEALEKPGVGFTQGNASDPDTYYRSDNDVYLMWKTNRDKTT